ncbi:carbon storage regulator CsrA [Arthrobacter koreensis]|uniref:carbon storage regulator CsrA n=1 Tax=Arthrobacter koreensis TaxID=199136 RepID=UPI002DB61DAB|nr:carbon storage regulator CsrA [Arthrobacter koreensis]MEB7505650.1 carbon storage regulator CsrA [Arthrobacter koreensis]
MLVLTRKSGEQILIGDDIVITVLDSRGDGVRIGIDAPRGVKIQRNEVVRAVEEANVAAAAAGPEDEERIKTLLGLRRPEAE